MAASRICRTAAVSPLGAVSRRSGLVSFEHASLRHHGTPAPWARGFGFTAAQRVKAVWAPVSREPLLFTPGPLTTSAAVKQAMLVDYGSRDKAFLEVVADIRTRLLKIAGASTELGYECILMQGSGTMGVEAMLGALTPQGKLENGSSARLLLVVNGAYGDRQAKICDCLNIPYSILRFTEREMVCTKKVLSAIQAEQKSTDFSHLSMVHHETTTGILNPIKEIIQGVKAEHPSMTVFIDSMSAFGACEIQMDWGVDCVVSSPNKCIEGVPGFSFLVCRRELLAQSKGHARSLSMDLQDQWQYMEATGQFRHTPPTHSILAFQKALDEWDAEGGLEGRAGRYKENFEVLKVGMEALGFKFYVPEDQGRSFLISTFHTPEVEGFSFDTFYSDLSDRGFLIYPGKVSSGPSFRIGNMGRLFPRDCQRLVSAVASSCRSMQLDLPLKS